MFQFSATNRIVFGLVSLTVTVLLTCGLLGFIPNADATALRSRETWCETAAVSFMAMASRMDQDSLQETLEQIKQRRDDVESLAIRREKEIVLHCGDHEQHWQSIGSSPSGQNEFIVPVYSDDQPWGQLEIRFLPLPGISIFGHRPRSDIMLAATMGSSLLVLFSLFLRRVLRQLNPGKVVPNRVREALNALGEGLLVLDKHQTVVLANDAFTKHTGVHPEQLIGHQPERLGFSLSPETGLTQFPWTMTAVSAEPVYGSVLTLGDGSHERAFSVSTVPVRDDAGRNRGVVASFEDITDLRRRQTELADAVTSLKTSSEAIQQQNRELEWLATRDALTGCVNRRSFFRSYETEWEKSESSETPLSVVMVDIDHFKSINDNYGHGTGDEVLRDVAAVLMMEVLDTDIVCRYGGEEFAILMPNTGIDVAEQRAERCRQAIADRPFSVEGLAVTSSLGVSDRMQLPETPQEMLDQADKCLYVAKRNGRDQVVRWDEAQVHVAELAKEEAPKRETAVPQLIAEQTSAIPYHAVAALTTALAHRDRFAAAHSRRVADLCVATAEGLLSMWDCYVLEIAALLHDIGMIGIPDSLLHKTDPLTEEERSLLLRYNHLSVEIIEGSFGRTVLTEIVAQHVIHYDMTNADRGSVCDSRLSLAARILGIANAYDTMMSAARGRRPMSSADAIAELRRCAGTQFDPELVERFITTISVRMSQQEAIGDVSLESALRVGTVLEKIVCALDAQDFRQLRDCAEKLRVTAAEFHLREISYTADQLMSALREGTDMIEVMELAGRLLDQCRATQSRLVHTDTATA